MRAPLLLLAASLSVGIDLCPPDMGVCATDDACRTISVEKTCDGTWHPYASTPGTTDEERGDRLCVSLGYRKSGSRYTR